MAGPDGVQRRLASTELGIGPIDQYIFARSDEQRKAIKPLDALDRNHEFLLRGSAFDEGQLAEWIKVKVDGY